MTDDSFDFPASGGSLRPEENEIHVEFRSGYSDQPLGFSRHNEREKDYGEIETESAPEIGRSSVRGQVDVDSAQQAGIGRSISEYGVSADSDPVPAKISEMKAIYFNFSYASRSSAWFFYQQGKFMEDYEDYVFYDRPFKRYYPTYNDLSVRQLRGYFGWRTRFREGRNDPSVPTSFLYLYIYELLDNIGVEPDEGFAELRYMDETFGAKDETMHRHLTAWTRDYVVYYGLDAACAAMYFSNVGGGARSALRSFEETGEAAPGLFEAVESLSSYHVGRSPCYKKDPEGMQQAVLKSIQRVSEYLKAQGRGTLSGHCLGTVHPHSVRLFAGAVFYDHLRYEDYTYEVSPARIYRCHRGVWTLEQDTAAERPSALIGWILRETDRQMRLQTGSGRELQPSPGSPEPLVAVVRQAVADYLQEKKEAARPKITFDMSSLGRIRRDADVVMASLLVDEPDEEQFPDDESWGSVADEMPIQGSDESRIPITDDGYNPKHGESQISKSEERPSIGIAPYAESSIDIREEKDLDVHQHEGSQSSSSIEAVPAHEPAQAASSVSGLTEDEAEFLHMLLTDGPWKEFVRERHLLPSMLADSINEKLMDMIGDVVIEFDGEDPVLIEDYEEELEGLFSGGL